MSASSAAQHEVEVVVKNNMEDKLNLKRLEPTSQSGGHQNDAIPSHIVGRMNAYQIDEAEVQALLDERKSLILKKYESGLSVLESYRLKYVRWSLDRIDDARHGAGIDALEAHVFSLKALQEEIGILSADMKSARSKQNAASPSRPTK